MAAITYRGESLIASKQANGEHLNIDRIVLANIPGLDPSQPVDRNEQLPPADQIVLDDPISQHGYINPNLVVYSLHMGTGGLEFDFNWLGLYSEKDDVVIAITYLPTQSKDPSLAMTRNFMLEFSGAAETTDIHIDAESWQVDFSARMEGTDGRARQMTQDVIGRQLFYGDACKVVKGSGGYYDVLPGDGYVAGIRFNYPGKSVLVSETPTSVWLDVSQQGNAMSDIQPIIKVVISSEDLNDYLDKNGIFHYVEKISGIGNQYIADYRRINAGAVSSVTHQTLEEARKDKNIGREHIKLAELGGVELRKAEDEEEFNKYPDLAKIIDDGNHKWVFDVKDHINLKWFGIKYFDESEAESNSHKLRAAVLLSLVSKEKVIDYPFGGYANIMYNRMIYAPAGEIFLSGNSPFRVPPVEFLPITGNKYKRGLKFKGDGRNATVFTLLSNKGGGDVWFYDSTDDDLTNQGGYDHVVFEDMTLQGEYWNNEHGQHPWDKVPEGSKTNGFRLFAKGWEKFFIFTQCQLNGLDTLVKASGDNHGASNHFSNCYIRDIRDCVLDQRNGQAIATQFQGCDMEHLTGDLLRITEYGGGYVLIDGGSIIMQPRFLNGKPDQADKDPKALVHVFTDDTAQLNRRGSRYSFRNCTYEIYDDLSKIVYFRSERVNTGGSFEANFENCSWHTVYRRDSDGNSIEIEPGGPRVDAVDIKGRVDCEIMFENCGLHHHYNYRMSGATQSNDYHKLVFKDCRSLWDVASYEDLSQRIFLSDYSYAISERTRISNPPTFAEEKSLCASDFVLYGDLCREIKGSYQCYLKHPKLNWTGNPPKVILPKESRVKKITASISSTGKTEDVKLIVKNSSNDIVYQSEVFEGNVGIDKVIELQPSEWFSPGDDGLVFVSLDGATGNPNPAGFVMCEYF